MEIPSQGLNQCISCQDLKKCNRCKETKPIAEFYKIGYRQKKTPGKQAPMAECKSCAKERVRTRYYGPMYAELRSKDNAAAKSRRDQIKAIVFAKYGGSKGSQCACCGETELTFLTLDHINNDGAAFRRNQFGRQTAAGYTTYSWLFKHRCPPGFQILCANCQHGKRMNGGVCPHKEARCNDYPVEGVGPSGPKRSASVSDEDIVSSAMKVAAALRTAADFELAPRNRR